MVSTFLIADMSDAVAAMATGYYEIRPGAVTSDDGFGRSQRGPTPDPIPSVLCGVYPVGGIVTRPLPEGARADEWRDVFTAYPLRPAEESTQRYADSIIIDSAVFDVQEAQPWQSASGVTYARVKRVGQ